MSAGEKMIGRVCVIRTFSAGVHVGILAYQHGSEVVLHDAHRIWRWRGANTLHELSQNGASSDWTRVSDRVPEILLTEAIEIIPCSVKADENLRNPRWSSCD